MLDIYLIKKLEGLFNNDEYLQNGTYNIALTVNILALIKQTNTDGSWFNVQQL